ncbi:MAG: putative zinc-binding protein [Anaerolineaceae bacterium]
MSETHKKVVIVPCSGIGKSYGTVSRMAAFQVTEDDRPTQTQLVPLALLVMGDEDSQKILSESQAITIDGCKLACATKMVQQSGGLVARDFAVLDVFRRYRDFKPQGIGELNEGGEKLADALAQEINAVVDELSAPKKGETHA